jgi:uncharacterized integral membrane protein
MLRKAEADKGEADNGVRRQFRGTGLSWTLVLALVVAVAIVVGIIQNSHGVRLDYLVWHGTVPLVAVLLATIVLTVALTSLVGLIWRRRRRQRMTDAVELGELRGQVQPRPSTEGVPAAGEVVGTRNPAAFGAPR